MPSEEDNIVDFVFEIQKVNEAKEGDPTLVDSDDDENWEEVLENEDIDQMY